MEPRRSLFAVVMLCATVVSICDGGERLKISVTSSADQTKQPSYVLLPDNFDPDGKPIPLLVSLHSWSGDLEQRNEPLERLANERGWICLFPNFRGRNDHPEACGSEIAQQDILDVIEWVKSKYPIDGSRIYLSGNSGGGHMTMMMVGLANSKLHGGCV